MIKSLQSIRFILILLVFIHHYFGIKQFGYYPVAFFFILSGFLMSLGYVGKVTGETFSYKKFLIKRLVHIYPLNFIGLIVFLFFSYLYCRDISLRPIIPDVLLLQTWWRAYILTGNRVCWFLADIVFCYFMFPLLIRKFMKLTRLYLFLFILMLICYFVLINYTFFNDHYFIYFCPLSRIIDFSFGIWLYLLFKKVTPIINSHLTFRYSLIEVIAVSVNIAFLILFRYIPERFSLASYFWLPSMFMILVLAINHEKEGVVTKILGNKLLFYMGGISFSFYVFHDIVIKWFRAATSEYGYTIPDFIGFILCLLSTLSVSYIYSSFLEPFFVRRLGKLYE